MCICKSCLAIVTRIQGLVPAAPAYEKGSRSQVDSPSQRALCHTRDTGTYSRSLTGPPWSPLWWQLLHSEVNDPESPDLPVWCKLWIRQQGSPPAFTSTAKQFLPCQSPLELTTQSLQENKGKNELNIFSFEGTLQSRNGEKTAWSPGMTQFKGHRRCDEHSSS